MRAKNPLQIGGRWPNQGADRSHVASMYLRELSAKLL